MLDYRFPNAKKGYQMSGFRVETLNCKSVFSWGNTKKISSSNIASTTALPEAEHSATKSLDDAQVIPRKWQLLLYLLQMGPFPTLEAMQGL